MEYRSLCETCMFAPSCHRCQTQSRPVIYCEEYQEFSSADRISGDNGPEARNMSRRELRGLCSICQNRRYCTIKIPEGGIWHCDNFS